MALGFSLSTLPIYSHSLRKRSLIMDIFIVVLIVAKLIEAVAIAAMVLLVIVIPWDLTEELRENRRELREMRRKIQALERREARRKVRTEHSQELAKARMHAATERAKEKLRMQKEKDAHESFFNDNYPCGFDSEGNLIHGEWVIPTEKGREYLKEMDKISDDITMATTLSKEL